MPSTTQPLNAENLMQKARWIADLKIREAKEFGEYQAILMQVSFDKKWDEH